MQISYYYILILYIIIIIAISNGSISQAPCTSYQDSESEQKYICIIKCYCKTKGGKKPDICSLVLCTLQAEGRV